MAQSSPAPYADHSIETFTTFEIAKGQKVRVTPPGYVDDATVNLSENSLKVLQKRYLRRDIDGSLLESAAGMFYRVAHHIAGPEAEHGGDVESTTQTFYDLLSELRFFPNSPTFTGAGTPLGQLAACFVLPIEDDMGRASDGIFSTLRVAALIQQTGGGNGFSFSRLRPKGDVVHTSSGRATGPVGFLRVYDQAFGEIAQGGTRRGANMGVLRVDHPDIEEFITCKAEEGTVTNFNISVAITDEFMQAVKNDGDFDLRSPRDGKVWRTVRARELFDKIIHYAHHNGEPGALFIDAANRTNPVPHLYDLEATNPCVTGDTLIYTADGLQRADALARTGAAQEVVVDGRFGVDTLQPASEVFATGVKDVYRLETKEGYSLRLTGNHQVMTGRGWVEARHLQPGDRVHVLNRSGGFGTAGTRELGLVLGWLVGDGTVNQIRAVLSFFGEEKSELAPLFAEAVTALVDTDGRYRARPDRSYPVGITEILERDEVRVQSDRLRLLAEEYGLDLDKLQVPDVVLRGTQATQQAFLQALFTADGTVNDGGDKGCSVRLTSVSESLLQDVQRLLLNFGIFSRIYRERRPAGMRRLPDGKGGYREYFCQAYHELAIAKSNLLPFAESIGFLSQAKQSALLAYLDRMQRGPYQETFTARVSRLVHTGQEMVYDLTQPSTHSFIANGFVVHNCGEQWLGPYENCCLGSINLGLHVTEDGAGQAVVDWAGLERTIRESTHFLDNVVSANAYVPAVPEVAEAAYRARRIGLGIMGLGDLMYKLGIRYGSPEGQEFAGQVMEFVRYHCMARSVELSEERGPFLAFDGSIYDRRKSGGMSWQPPAPVVPFERDWGRPALDWAGIVRGIERHGIRNAAQTTVAPTGTIATVSGCEGYGCEPVFALGYIRHFKDGDKDVELVYTSPLFEQALDKTDLSESRKKSIKQHAATYGSVQELDGLPDALRHTFVVSSDISAEEHVRMQAAIQAFVDNSISKCVVGDTLLLTGEGLVAIEDLSAMRLPDQFEPRQQNIVSPAGVEMSDAFYYGGYRETRKVALEYGFQLEGTPNHRIHVLAKDGTVQFAELNDLRPGDTVVLYGGQQQFGKAGRALPAYRDELRTNSSEVHFPKRMSVDLAFLLGCITSEGAITRNGVMISNNDVALLTQLETIIQQQFGLRSLIIADTRNSVHTLQVNSRPLRNWLLTELRMEAGAESKVVPNCVLQASREEIAGFLRGLFLDGYMTQDGKLCGITLASQRAIEQLQLLLLNMGILATVRQTTERAWNLTVQGGELENLAHEISFVEAWKNERIERRNVGRIQRFRNYSRLLPRALTNALREKQIATPVSLRSLYVSEDNSQDSAYQRARVNLLQGHRLERSDAFAIYQHLHPTDDADFAQNFFGQDSESKIYVEVQSIESGFAEVFDISVPGSHTFIANGMGNHNTCNFPEGATEEDVANAYLLAWELGCKGLTVYVTGSRQEVVLETKATKEKKSDGESVAESSPNGYVNGSNGYHPQEAQPVFTKRPRPSLLQGSTYRKETPLGTAYITVNSDTEGEPFEVFLNIGKAGSDVSAVSEALGRLISLTLRMPASLPPSERLRWVMDEMAGIGGGRALGFGANRVRSLPDGVAQVIAEHLSALPAHPEPVSGEQMALPLADRPIGDLCPDCGEAAFLNVEGCKKCAICGYSEC